MSYSRKGHSFLLHLAFWTFYILLNALIYMNFYEVSERIVVTGSEEQIIPGITFPATFFISLRNQVLEIPGKLLLVYINLFILLPYLLLRSKYVEYLMGLLLSIVFMAWIQKVIAINIFLPLLFPKLQVNDAMFSVAKFIQYTASAFSLLFFTSAIKILLEWQNNQKHTQELEKRRMSTELELLRTQLSPHFFFNTLNSLYGLAMESSKNTANMILRLSDMMNYMLYESNSKDVLASKEIDAIVNYVELEKIRYGKRVELSLKQHGDFSQLRIAPLLMLPFVENAFKHGVAPATDRAWLNMTLSLQDRVFTFKVENSRWTKSKSHSLAEGKMKGIGLENVKRRLKLLYPNSYNLKIDESSESAFSICLEINI